MSNNRDPRKPCVETERSKGGGFNLRTKENDEEKGVKLKTFRRSAKLNREPGGMQCKGLLGGGPVDIKHIRSTLALTRLIWDSREEKNLGWGGRHLEGRKERLEEVRQGRGSKKDILAHSLWRKAGKEKKQQVLKTGKLPVQRPRLKNDDGQNHATCRASRELFYQRKEQPRP